MASGSESYSYINESRKATASSKRSTPKYSSNPKSKNYVPF